MQTVYIVDNLLKIPEPVFWKKRRKIFDTLSAENFTQSATGKC